MTTKLKTDINIKDYDNFYEKLIDLHADLSTEDSLKLNAKIIMMMANHIGDDSVLGEILEYVRNNH